jgi:hypothetical protein
MWNLALNKNEGNFANINGNAGQSITASSITLSGGGAGVGNHAEIFDAGTTTTQSISASEISLTGGAGGGIDSGSTGTRMGNYALIQGAGRRRSPRPGCRCTAAQVGMENFAQSPLRRRLSPSTAILHWLAGLPLPAPCVAEVRGSADRAATAPGRRISSSRSTASHHDRRRVQRMLDPP